MKSMAMASEWYITLLNDPQGFWQLFVLLLTTSLLAGVVVTASETGKKKKEQMERHLAKHERRQDENGSHDFIAPYESEEFDRG